MPRESSIVNSILDYLNGLKYCAAEKVQGTTFSSGKADINCCFKGHSLRIEVKTPDHGNKPTKKQEINLRRWKAAGAYCISAYSLEEVKKLIEEVENNGKICNKSKT